MKLNLAYKKRHTEGYQKMCIEKNEMNEIVSGADPGEVVSWCITFCYLLYTIQGAQNSAIRIGVAKVYGV